MQFRDRRHAGMLLGEALNIYRGRANAVVLALPRGGVPVGYEVARVLGIMLDVFLVRKLGAPGREELAMGAIASGGIRILNRDVIDSLQIDRTTLERVVARERSELQRREMLYRGDRGPPEVAGRVAILVDDGLATGSTMRAAVAAVRALDPAGVVVAVPTGSAEACRTLSKEADDVVCLSQPEPFHAVGMWYADFRQTEDSEVHELLTEARAAGRQATKGTDGQGGREWYEQ